MARQQVRKPWVFPDHLFPNWGNTTSSFLIESKPWEIRRWHRTVVRTGSLVGSPLLWRGSTLQKKGDTRHIPRSTMQAAAEAEALKCSEVVKPKLGHTCSGGDEETLQDFQQEMRSKVWKQDTGHLSWGDDLVLLRGEGLKSDKTVTYHDFRQERLLVSQSIKWIW
jgi:hypothetical protein